MTASKIAAYNAELHRRTEVKQLDQRHEERRVEERRIKYQLEVDEQKRIEMNRRMNRAGQNVDKLA